MPDPLALLLALAVAALVAAIARGACARRPAAGWLLGLALAEYAGVWWLELWPHWPPATDQDRLLIVVLPAVVAVESLALVARLPRSAVWTGRALIAVLAARVLLHGSVYLSDGAGESAPFWSVTTAWLALAGLALAAEWAAIDLLAERGAGVALSITLAGTVAGTSLALMLSGYLSGGQLGLPLAGGIVGAAVASAVVERPVTVPAAAAAVASVTLFSLVLIGHFFAELSLLHGVLLLVAIPAGWVLELPRLNRLSPNVRGVLRVVLAAAIVGGVVLSAQRQFASRLQSAGGSGSDAETDAYYGS